MTAAVVKSRRDNLVKRLREVRDGKDRTHLFVEGAKTVSELLGSPLAPAEAYITKDFHENPKNGPLLNALRKRAVAPRFLSSDVMAFVSDLEKAPGILALAKRPCPLFESLPSSPSALYVLLDGLQLPSNVGAVVRTAEAAGAAAVLVCTGGADPYGPKALRASAGSAFRLPLLADKSLAEWLRFLVSRGVRPVAADARGQKPYTEWDWKKPTALLLGCEGTGFRENTTGLATLRIPLADPVESLNVSVAAGVLLFEARRQRHATL